MKATVRSIVLTGFCMALLLGQAPAWSADVDTATPTAMVQTYESLADAILAAKKTEWNLVHSILAATYQHAEGVMHAAARKLEAGQSASGEIEKLAALVAHLGNEGDASVAAVRKRLIEGGHHHHSGGEQKGVYDEGFVIVTREAKKAFLDSSKKIGRMRGTSDVTQLRDEWAKVDQKFRAVCESARQ